MSHLRHHHVLTLANVRVFRLDDSLEESEVLHVPAVGLDASNEMLHDTFGDFTAQSSVVVEQHAQCLGFQQLPWHNNISLLAAVLLTSLHTNFTHQ